MSKPSHAVSSHRPAGVARGLTQAGDLPVAVDNVKRNRQCVEYGLGEASVFLTGLCDRIVDRGLVVRGKVDAHRGHLRRGLDHLYLRIGEILLVGKSNNKRSADLSVDVNWRDILEFM